MTEQSNKPTVVEPASLKRFTMARVYGKVPTVATRTPLVSVVYHVDFIAQEESPDGTFPRFQGEFKAINLANGDVFTTANAVFPSVLSADIEAAKGDASPNITGHSEIGVEPGEGGQTVYYVEHMIAPARRSVLDLLKAWGELQEMATAHVQPEVDQEAPEPVAEGGRKPKAA